MSLTTREKAPVRLWTVPRICHQNCFTFFLCPFENNFYGNEAPHQSCLCVRSFRRFTWVLWLPLWGTRSPKMWL